LNLETPTPHVEKRQSLSRFICQELLYEFVSGRLDPERQKAVDSYLETCRDSQRELECLKKGLMYSLVAAKTQVSPELHAALLSFEPQWKKTFSAWTERFSTTGWKVLPHVFLLSLLVLAVMAGRPWIRAPHFEDLVQQLKTEPDIVSPPADVKIDSPALTQPVEMHPAPTPLAVPNPVKEPPTVAKAEPTVTTPMPMPEPEEKKTVYEGQLTRGDLEVEDFANTWPAIRDKVVALGGKAAGNVELGWQRRKGESYFHFSLPESNQGELELFLKTFGPVRFSTESHPRVMPEGQIRIILTVKDGGHDDREETEAP
jgi:hypothetical protein